MIKCIPYMQLISWTCRWWSS